MAGNLVRARRRSRAARPDRGRRLEPANDPAVPVRQLDHRPPAYSRDIWVRLHDGDLRACRKATLRLLRDAGPPWRSSRGARRSSDGPPGAEAIDPGRQRRARVRRHVGGARHTRGDRRAGDLPWREGGRLRWQLAISLAAGTQRLTSVTGCKVAVARRVVHHVERGGEATPAAADKGMVFDLICRGCGAGAQRTWDPTEAGSATSCPGRYTAP